MTVIKTRIETKKKIYNDDDNNSVGKNYNYTKLKTILKTGEVVATCPAALLKAWSKTDDGRSRKRAFPHGPGRGRQAGFPRDAGENHLLIQWQRDAASKH